MEKQHFIEKIDEVLQDHGFFAAERENFFEAMGDILALAAEQIKETEPYATATLARLMQTRADVNDYGNFIENFTS